MNIRVWGARGSIPVSGREYIKYGGDTTCLEVRTKNDDIIIIDAGTGLRRLGNLLVKEGRTEYHMLFTHVHWDHLLGFPFFKPLYRDDTKIWMYGGQMAQDSIKALISPVMNPPNFPVNYDNLSAHIEYQGECELEFDIGSVEIKAIPISHPNEGMGYKLIEDGKSFVFLTDNELTYVHPGGRPFEEYLEFSKGTDLLIHDTEFTAEEYKRTKTWGHSVYNDVVDMAMRAGVKTLCLWHHNQDRKDDQVDWMLEDCRRLVKENGGSLECIAAYQDMEISL